METIRHAAKKIADTLVEALPGVTFHSTRDAVKITSDLFTVVITPTGSPEEMLTEATEGGFVLTLSASGPSKQGLVGALQEVAHKIQSGELSDKTSTVSWSLRERLQQGVPSPAQQAAVWDWKDPELLAQGTRFISEQLKGRHGGPYQVLDSKVGRLGNGSSGPLIIYALTKSHGFPRQGQQPWLPNYQPGMPWIDVYITAMEMPKTGKIVAPLYDRNGNYRFTPLSRLIDLATANRAGCPPEFLNQLTQKVSIN